MKSLYESILGKDYDGTPTDFLKAKEWIDCYCEGVKGLKLNKDGTVNCDELRIRQWCNLFDFPEYIKFKHVGKLSIIDVQQWNGTNWPETIDKLYIDNIPGFKDLTSLSTCKHIKELIIVECTLEKKLKPKSCKFGTVTILRCLPWLSTSDQRNAMKHDWQQELYKHKANLVKFG